MAVLTKLTERDGLGVLGMSMFHIPTGSSAVLNDVSTFYLVPSDKHLNNYTTGPRSIPSNPLKIIIQQPFYISSYNYLQ
jgi:hypothetical protein